MNGVGEAEGTPNEAAMDQGEDKADEGMILLILVLFFFISSFLSLCTGIYTIMLYSEKGVPDFWLTAMKNNEVLSDEVSYPVIIVVLTFFLLEMVMLIFYFFCGWNQINERDEGALKYLKDIKWYRIDEPKGFKLEFYFDNNPYFKNTVLTKTYHMIDEDEPILEKAIGYIPFFFVLLDY